MCCGVQDAQGVHGHINGMPPRKGRKGFNSGDKTEREMTFLDKRRLAQQIGALHGPHLSGVAEIIQAAGVPESDDEMVLDLEQLDNQTLWKLKHYVDSVQSARRKGKPSKRAPQPGKVDPNGVEQASSQMLESATVDTDCEDVSDLSLGTR